MQYFLIVFMVKSYFPIRLVVERFCVTILILFYKLESI